MRKKPLGPWTLRVALPRALAAFVRERVESGLCTTASEVVREALRMLASLPPRAAEGDVPVDSLALLEAAIDRAAAQKGMRLLQRLRRGNRLGAGITTKDLVDDGRR